jgi:hypothetical protein
MSKNPAAVALGRKGGKAYAKNTTDEQRKESARHAAEARWAKTRKLLDEITEGSKALLAKSRKRQALLRKGKTKAIKPVPSLS